MRVVGGKTGADGRLFAYLVWTVPGGPAEKMGLQQGDKVSKIVKAKKKNAFKSFGIYGLAFGRNFGSIFQADFIPFILLSRPMLNIDLIAIWLCDSYYLH